MREDQAPNQGESFTRHPWVFAAGCVAAGALAVPPDPKASLAAAVIAGLVGLLGLQIWRWSGLATLTGTRAPGTAGPFIELAVPVGLGLAVGLVLLGVIRLAIEPAVPAVGARLAATAALPLWRRLVVIYVAAVGEELVFRILLLSFVAGLAVRVFRLADRRPNPIAGWTAIGCSALVFGAAHLPAWSAVTPLHPGLALGIVTLNALGGAVFGWVFVTRGIVAAMLAHAGADIAMQLIGPLTG